MTFTTEQKRVLNRLFIFHLHRTPHIWKFDKLFEEIESKLSEDTVNCEECSFVYYPCEKIRGICPECYENKNK